MKGKIKGYEKSKIAFAVRRAIAETLRGKLDRSEMTKVKGEVVDILKAKIAALKVDRRYQPGEHKVFNHTRVRRRGNRIIKKAA